VDSGGVAGIAIRQQINYTILLLLMDPIGRTFGQPWVARDSSRILKVRYKTTSSQGLM
jgi:hypothetical protein